MVSQLAELRKALRACSHREKAAVLRRFFKTGPGEYGEGDVFIGVVVPDIRSVARQFRDADETVVLELLRSKVHEERLTALIILVLRYARAPEAGRERIYRIYLDNTRYINNWDLVDVTCRDIVGAHLWTRSREPLYALARSADLWERRIAIVSTYYFIQRNYFDDTLKLAVMLMGDKHDLIHKAGGWMLREVYKRDPGVIERFLTKHAPGMPRTMLRYAIERFPEQQRRTYLLKAGKVRRK